MNGDNGRGDSTQEGVDSIQGEEAMVVAVQISVMQEEDSFQGDAMVKALAEEDRGLAQAVAIKVTPSLVSVVVATLCKVNLVDPVICIMDSMRAIEVVTLVFREGVHTITILIVLDMEEIITDGILSVVVSL
jgi:hypothetical protein